MTLRPLENWSPTMTAIETTALIQEALDTDGHVCLDRRGTYTINGLVLRSNMILEIEDHVTLEGSSDETSYIWRPGPFELVRNETPICSLLSGTDLDNVCIRGQGRIRGAYEHFATQESLAREDSDSLEFHTYPRPMTIYLENCENVELSGITLQDNPFWTVHLVGCCNVNISRLTIVNDLRMPNTDGIDLDRCKDTLIEDCDISTGDDAICLKLNEECTQYGDCENIVVRDCRLQSQSAAIKLGSTSFGRYNNLLFENIVIRDSNRGLGIQLRDGGATTNLKFHNIDIETKQFSKQWWGSAEPIHISYLPRFFDTDLAQSSLKHIAFENVRSISPSGVVVHVDPRINAENITFKNCNFAFSHPAQGNESISYDLRPAFGPSALSSAQIPIVTTVNGISLEGFEVPLSQVEFGEHTDPYKDRKIGKKSNL